MYNLAAPAAPGSAGRPGDPGHNSTSIGPPTTPVGPTASSTASLNSNRCIFNKSGVISYVGCVNLSRGGIQDSDIILQN